MTSGDIMSQHRRRLRFLWASFAFFLALDLTSHVSHWNLGSACFKVYNLALPLWRIQTLSHYFQKKHVWKGLQLVCSRLCGYSWTVTLVRSMEYYGWLSQDHIPKPMPGVGGGGVYSFPEYEMSWKQSWEEESLVNFPPIKYYKYFQI